MKKGVVERIYPNDTRVKPQTIAHHMARYKFACNYQTPEGAALDLACGTGYGTNMLREAGYYSLGIDKSPEAIKYAENNFPKSFFIIGNITNFSYPVRFKLITFFEAIEHISHKDGVALLKKLKKSLTPDGVLILSTPRDINEKNNGFHKSRWDYKELINVLNSIFDEVKILGQDWDDATISDKNVIDNDFYVCVCKVNTRKNE